MTPAQADALISAVNYLGVDLLLIWGCLLMHLWHAIGRDKPKPT